MREPGEPPPAGATAEPASASNADLDPRLRSSRLYADEERLRKQVALSWPREAEVLVRLGLADGMCLLDAGCGPGFVAEELLRLLPASPVVALDLDATMTSLAEARLGQQAAGRLIVLTGSALNIDLDDDSFDFAIARFLFQHLAAPDLAASELHRLLRPGGQLAVIEIDDAIAGIVDPPMPAMGALGAKVGQLQAALGGNRYVGRILWRLLQQAGFENLAVTPVLIHSDDAGLEAFLPQYDPERFRPFIAPGGLTHEEWEAYRADFARFLSAPDRYIAHLLLVVSGRKPG